MPMNSGGRLRRLGILVLAGAALLAPRPASAADTNDPTDMEETAAGEPTPAEPAAQSLEADSGVAVQTVCTNCNNADLSLGALGNDHVVVTCDGQLVPPGLAQIYLLSVMPQTLIDKIAVNKGACRAEYEGGAVGGGLEIERRTAQPGLQVSASTDIGDFGWRGNKVDLMGKSGKVGGFFAGSWARSDKIDPNQDGQANLPEFDRTTLEAGVQFEPSRNHHLRFGAATYQELQRDGPAGPYLGTSIYNRENVDLSRTQYDGVYEWSGRGGSTLSIAGMWARRGEDISETDSPDSVCINLLVLPTFLFERFCPTYLIDEVSGRAAIAWSHPIGTQAKFAMGVSRSRTHYDVIDVKFNFFAGLPSHFKIEETVKEHGIWIEGQTALGAHVELTAGARYVKLFYVDNENRPAWLGISLPKGDRVLPRTALTWKPTGQVNLRLTAGAGFRSPAPAFSEVCCGNKYRGNRGIVPESSVSYGIEATFQPSPHVRVGSSAFLTDFDNLLVHMITMSNNQNTYQYVNVPRARKASLTVDGRIQGPAWMTARLSYSWIRARNRTAGDDIPVLLDFGTLPTPDIFHYTEIPTSVDRRGAVGLDFLLPRSFSLGIGAQYTGTTHVQFIDKDTPLPSPAPITGEIATSYLVEKDDFWVVNASLRKQFQSGLELFAGMDNAFDFFQTDLDDSHFNTNWGPLRGRYVYGGLGYHFDSNKNEKK